MDADECRSTLNGYLDRELLEIAATRLARLAVEEGWYLYYNPDLGAPERPALLPVLQRRVEELVAARRATWWLRLG
jgi:hypothetical protein